MGADWKARVGVRRLVPIARIGVGAGAGWKVALFVVAAILGLLFFISLFVASISSAVGEGSVCTVVGRNGEAIPASYVPWLERAATKYELGPRGFAIVAAVHKVESDFGRSTEPGVHSGENGAGAGGPGQFLQSSWEAYGVDADGDGVANRYSVPDSIFATANYLHAAGAPQDWYGALFAYNHADWYVEEVLATAANFSARQVCHPVSSQLGDLPSGAVQRIEYVARWIEARHIHYCWGGGHGPKPGPSTGTYCWTADGRQVFGSRDRGLDCSGAVRWLLVLAGYPDPGPLVSDGFASAYPSGPGSHVTIWSSVSHVFISIDGRTWGTSSSNVGHGPGFAGHSTAGFVASHPPGL
jgi:hypothetical protein